MPVALDSFGEQAVVAPSIGEHSSLDSTGLFHPAQLRELEDAGLITVQNLLELDPAEERFGLSADQVDRWQAQLWLMLNVPTLRAQDAAVLVACGIQEPAQIATSRSQQLYERINRFLSTTRGKHTHWSQISIELDRVHRWIDAVNRTRSSWQRRGRRRRSTESNSSRRQSRTDRYRESRDRDRGKPGRSSSTRTVGASATSDAQSPQSSNRSTTTRCGLP